jgi:hypothetical protein
MLGGGRLDGTRLSGMRLRGEELLVLMARPQLT